MQNLKFLFGGVCSKATDRILGASWFPLLRTFHLRRHWLYDVCRFAGTRKLQLAFDVGANVGRYSEWMARFLPETTIFSFEPVKQSFARLESVAANFDGRVRPFNLALGSMPGEFAITLHDYSEINSLRPNIDGELIGGSGQTEMVRVERLDAFCSMHGINAIDLLKTDTEGFDQEVLKGAGEFLESRPIPFIYTEVGFSAGDRSHTRFEDLLKFLEERGYMLKGFYDQWAENEAHELFCDALFIHPGEVKRRFGKA